MDCSCAVSSQAHFPRSQGSLTAYARPIIKMVILTLHRRSCLMRTQIGVRVGVAVGSGAVVAGVQDRRFGISRFGGEVGAGQARPVGRRRPEMVTRTRTPRCRPSCGRKGAPGKASGEAPMGSSCVLTGCLLQASRAAYPVRTGTDELSNK